MTPETSTENRERQPAFSAAGLLGALVQISKAHADGDEICLTIIQEPNTHIRVSLTPQNFADTLCTGRKVEARVVRWRIAPNAGTERQPPGEAVACNQTSQETKSADTGKRGGCSLQ